MTATAALPLLSINEGMYTAKELFLPKELEKAFRLRHAFFVDDKGWVSPTPLNSGIEKDRYDEYCHHLAVFQGDTIVAYLRILGRAYSPYGFMLEHDFSPLLSKKERRELAKEHAAEVSRLVVRQDPDFILNVFNKRKVVELLFKLFYHVCLREEYRHLYIVVEEGWLAAFNRMFSFGFDPLGKLYVFSDGTRTRAALGDLVDFETRVAENNPAKYLWYKSLC